MLFITADHGCDPGYPTTDHTREYIPLLVYGKHVAPVNLGVEMCIRDRYNTVQFAGGVEYMKITVGGCGRWGSCIAWYLDRNGHDVTVFGEEDAPTYVGFKENRTNGVVTFPESIHLTACLLYTSRCV